MAFGSGNKIAISDIVARFKTNCENSIMSKASIATSSYVPTADIGSSPTRFTQSMIGSTNSKITASTIINQLTNFVRDLTRVRKFQTRTYRNGNQGTSLNDTYNGWRIFKTSLPSLSSPKRTATASRWRAYQQTYESVPYQSGWTRNTSSGVQSLSSVTNPSVTSGSTINANNLSTFFTNLYNAWETRYNNAIVYENYFCYNDCHSNCHWSRSRR
jgi:hypothetical protein